MKTISTDKAPRAIGPYSQAIVSGNYVFCSGQIAINPDTNDYTPGLISEETNRVIQNLTAVLEAAGTSLEKVVKTTVFLSSMDDFLDMNAVYEEFFRHKPARATIEVSKLPKGAKVEIEVIAEV